MASLSFGDGSPTGVLSGVATYFGSGGTPAQALLASVFGVIISISQGGINVIQSIFGFIAGIIDAGADAAGAVFRATLIEPLGVLITGSEVSANSLGQFGFLAILVGVVLLLAVYWLITQFLEEEETSDFTIVPGAPDLPFIGVEEEGED